MAGKIQGQGNIIPKRENIKREVMEGNTRPISEWVQIYKPQISKVLPKMITPERFVRMCQNALSVNPKLLNCTETSFIGAMMNAASLGLEPNSPLGQAYLIPRKNGKTGNLECNFQIGYKGLIALAYRSGEVATCSAHEVYENDFFEYELGLNPRLEHRPAMNNRGNIYAYYAVWKGKNGGFDFAVMSKEDVLNHAKQYSQSKNKRGELTGAWASNFDGMARKTVLLQALRYAPLSTELQSSIAQDNTVKNFEPENDDFNIVMAPNTMYEEDEVITGELEEDQPEAPGIEMNQDQNTPNYGPEKANRAPNLEEGIIM